MTVSDFKAEHDLLRAYSVEQIGKALDKLGVEARRVQHSGVRKRLRLLPKRIVRESALDGRAAAQ